ncbi:hypothetical protein Syun_030001 [Stephania yunnanensis]|uniref:ABC transmembrane type-1 domain-containing protein n=1 Tax=Stephania yunnanensis TaxID=152371 RepID=A0AAP0EA01_9MAGN
MSNDLSRSLASFVHDLDFLRKLRYRLSGSPFLRINYQLGFTKDGEAKKGDCSLTKLVSTVAAPPVHARIGSLNSLSLFYVYALVSLSLPLTASNRLSALSLVTTDRSQLVEDRIGSDNLESISAYISFKATPDLIYEIGCWMYSSERRAAHLKLAFFRAVISQDIGAFDTDLSTGNIIVGNTNHMNVIQDAISEKLGYFLSCFATFFIGIVIAFINCWKAALCTLAVVPLISAIGIVYTKMMNEISTVKVMHLSEATSMVKQLCESIRKWRLAENAKFSKFETVVSREFETHYDSDCTLLFYHFLD